jgi:hypothetical protein
LSAPRLRHPPHGGYLALHYGAFFHLVMALNTGVVIRVP